MFMCVFFIFLFFLSRMHVSYFVCVFANSIKNSYKKKNYRLKTAAPYVKCMLVKAGVNVKAALTSLNTAFLPISRSHFKRR